MLMYLRATESFNGRDLRRAEGDQTFDIQEGDVLRSDSFEVESYPQFFEALRGNLSRAAVDALDALMDTCREMESISDRNGDRVDGWPSGQRERFENLGRRTASLRTVVRDEVRNRDEQISALRNLAISGSVEHGSDQGQRSTTDNRNRGDRGDQVRDSAMRVVDEHVRAEVLPTAAAELVERLVSTGPPRERDFASRWVQATGSDAYVNAFSKWFLDPERGHLLWTEQERDSWQRVHGLRAEQRAMSTVDAAGGYGALPYQLDPSVIITNAGTVNPLRKIARVVTTVTDKWRPVTTSGATASWDAEAAEVSDDSPTLASPEISVHRLQTFVPFSREIEEDWQGGLIVRELSAILVDAAERLMSTAYTVGSGVGQPKGLITALLGTASEVNVITPETFTSPDVYALIESLPARWRPNARWMANLSIINRVDQMETGNGSKQFPEVGDDRLLRRALHENSEMDGSWNVAATANNYILAVGDFSQFVLVDKAFSASVEVVPHLMGANQRPTGERGAYLYLRTGSDVTTVDAFRLLDLPTTA